MELDTKIIVNALNKHLRNHQKTALTKSQATVLAWCLKEQRITYHDMAVNGDYKATSLRDAGSKLFMILASVTGQRITKGNCGEAVRDWYEREIAVERSPLFGREGDLQTLLDALSAEGRRLLCLSGPPRVGKTYLVGQLCRQMQSNTPFEALIRCHATDLPTVELLYQSVSNFLGETYTPVGLSAATRLTHLLETRSLLLVVEKTEALHESDALGGRFKAESACYEQWLRTLLDRHSLRSCVILVCRVPPQCLRTSHDLLLHHPLRSLSESAAERLLRHHGLDRYPVSQLNQLAQFCGYNPGVLVAAAHKIVHSSDRDLATFMRAPLVVPYGDDQLWQEVWDDLTEQERELMGWLLLHPDAAIDREDRAGSRERRRVWPSVLQSLRTRGLVAVDADGAHFIETEWLRHVAQHNLSVRLAEAIVKTDVQAFSWHPLVVPQGPFWRRQRQWQCVLEPLGEHLERLERRSWTTQYRRDKINAMLDEIRAQPDHAHSYT
ncbi:MAG: ATP-binding protein, partial [Nodosilinea sp.]